MRLGATASARQVDAGVRREKAKVAPLAGSFASRSARRWTLLRLIPFVAGFSSVVFNNYHLVAFKLEIDLIRFSHSLLYILYFEAIIFSNSPFTFKSTVVAFKRAVPICSVLEKFDDALMPFYLLPRPDDFLIWIF